MGKKINNSLLTGRENDCRVNKVTPENGDEDVLRKKERNSAKEGLRNEVGKGQAATVKQGSKAGWKHQVRTHSWLS